jgi:hypothetical protein
MARGICQLDIRIFSARASDKTAAKNLTASRSRSKDRLVTMGSSSAAEVGMDTCSISRVPLPRGVSTGGSRLVPGTVVEDSRIDGPPFTS